MPGGRLLWHIAPRADWLAARAAGNPIAPDSLGAEGFVHCSYAGQVAGAANRHYRGRRDLVLLGVDPDAVSADVRVEAAPGTGEAYPHVYGPLPVGAVSVVVAFPCDPDGSFELPPDVID